MEHIVDYPPRGYHLESKPCPSMGKACFCTGVCTPVLVKDTGD